MNLAIHDIPTFRRLYHQGGTADFLQRGIIAWITPGMVQNWSGLDRYLAIGVLRLYDIGDGHAAFFETFKQRYKQPLAAREAKMLFLAEHSASVLLTTEAVVIQGAELHNLRVWSGDIRDLDHYFPQPAAGTIAETPPPPSSDAAQPCRPPTILSTEFPTDRRVPDRKGSLCVSRDRSRAGRRGGLSLRAVHAV